MLAWIARVVRLLRAAGRLADLEHRLRTQDNRATAWPLYVVEQRERIYGLDPQWSDSDTGYIWQYQDDHSVYYETDLDLLAEHCMGLTEGRVDYDFAQIEGRDEVTLEDCEYEKIYYTVRWKFVCAHLTEEAADLYVEQNAHRLTQPRVYVTSQYRCHEWQDVMLLLGQEAH